VATDTTPASLGTRSTRIADGALVLPGRGDDPDAPRFGDDVWDLSRGIHRRNIKASITRINFGSAPAHWRPLLKEFIYARLNEENDRPRSMQPSSAVGVYYTLKRFLTFLDDRALTLRTVTSEDLDAFLRLIKRTAPNPTSRTGYVKVIQHLYRLLAIETNDGVLIRPWKGRKASLVVKVAQSAENKTPRIPEEVMGPLLRMAIFYVQVASRDILAVRQEIATLLTAEKSPQRGASDRLAAWLSERSAKGRGLPALSPRAALRHSQGTATINAKQCLLMAGVASCAPTPKMRTLLHEASRHMPLEIGGLDTEISVDPALGLPWRDRFDRESATRETRMLIAACYIVIAYLSGMRDSEVQMLRRDCLDPERGEDGEVIRHRLKGRVYKDRKPEGEPARWVVLPVVTQAVEVLLALGDGDFLFERPSYKQHAVLIGHRIVDLLNQFASHVGHLRPGDAVPSVKGSLWHLTTTQFRRTVAWHIANQPFGDVAGMIQYQHVKITTFQGYAGTSESGFRAEIEQEEADARLRDVFDQYEDYVHGIQATSPGGERLHRQFEDVRQASGDLPGRVVDERRRRAMLASIAVNYYVGMFNDCILQEDTALCLRTDRADGERTLLPVLNLCSPAACPNSAITSKHRPAWDAQRAALEHRLTDDGLSPLQQTILRDQLVTVSEVTGRIS